MEVSLYEFESPLITISMKIYFNEKNQLMFSGYEIGDLVEKFMGDSDYEYYYTIEPNAVEKLATLFKLQSNQQLAILNEIKSQFGGKEAYQKFGNFMERNEIIFKKFTWR